MLPAAAADGRRPVEDQAKVRYVPAATTIVRRNGTDGESTVFTSEF